jgi:hypothetical protein
LIAGVRNKALVISGKAKMSKNESVFFIFSVSVPFLNLPQKQLWVFFLRYPLQLGHFFGVFRINPPSGVWSNSRSRDNDLQICLLLRLLFFLSCRFSFGRNIRLVSWGKTLGTSDSN